MRRYLFRSGRTAFTELVAEMRFWRDEETGNMNSKMWFGGREQVARQTLTFDARRYDLGGYE